MSKLKKVALIKVGMNINGTNSAASKMVSGENWVRTKWSFYPKI
jgi:hypothetical protein